MSTQEAKLQAIADAIREKDGTTEPIPANSFPERIRAISSVPEGLRTITLTADPPEGGTVTGGGLASDGMTLTVNAEPNGADNYLFDGWKENGSVVGEEPLLTFPVNADRALTAAFSVKPSRLPEGYTEVEYITIGASNAQWGYCYLSGVSIKFNSIRVVMDAMPKEAISSTKKFILLTMGYATENGLVIRSTGTSNQLEVYNGGVSTKFTYKMAANNRITIDCDIPNKKLTIGDSLFRLSTTTSAFVNNTFGIGRGSPGYSEISFFMDIYSIQVYSNEELVADIVPCISPNGVAGVFNLASNSFCDGVNGLTAGPPI